MSSLGVVEKPVVDSLPIWHWATILYLLLVPVVAMHAPGVGGLGLADLLMPVGFACLIFCRPKNRVQLSHVALLGFVFAALVSLLMIENRRIALDCTIRWVRMLAIVVPFFFGLVLTFDPTRKKRLFLYYGIGGFIAVAIGIFLHTFQIEVRQDQQKLWLEDGFQLRAGGLIGNSGAYGHATATWCVTTISWILLVSNWRRQKEFAIGVGLVAMYAIYIGSSRAALLHLLVGMGTFCFLTPSKVATRQKLAGMACFGILVLAIGICSAKLTGGGAMEKTSAMETNLKRFVPGLSGDVGEFTSNRAGNWPEYIAMFSESVVFGSGYKTGVRMHEESPDNSVLSVLLETGVVGFTMMSLFVFAILYRLSQLYRCETENSTQYATIGLVMCAGQLINCATSDIYTFWITMPVVYLLLGVLTQEIAADQVLNSESQNSLTRQLKFQFAEFKQ